MNCFIFLVLLLSSSSYVSSRTRSQYLRGNDDIFEDALLERLHDLRRDQDRYGSYLYDDEEEDDNTPKIGHDALLHVLNEIKREKSKKHAEQETNIKNNQKRNSKEQEEKESQQLNLKLDANSPYKVKDNENMIKKESHDIKILNIETEKKEVSANVNNQVASVIPDDSLEKQNKLDNEVNLRDVLEDPITNAPNTTSTQKNPSHSHVKQKITSSRVEKKGLDKVSFIAVVAGCCVAAVAGIALAAYCWYKLRSDDKNEGGKDKEIFKPKSQSPVSLGKKSQSPSPSDVAAMAASTELYQFAHVKSQIKQLGEQSNVDGETFRTGDATDDDDDENDENVYECPGPAASGDMKVVNPNFSDTESIQQSDRQSASSQGGSPTPSNDLIDQIAQHDNTSSIP